MDNPLVWLLAVCLLVRPMLARAQAAAGQAEGDDGLPGPVLTGPRTDRLVADFLARRAEAKVAELRRKYPAENTPRWRERVRQALAATYLRPQADRRPQSVLLGRTRVDGVAIERRVLRIAEGLYSTALVYLPYDPEEGAPTARHPGLLSLPGHGDQNWAPGNQERGLTLARRGWVTMWVQPFGQMELGDQPTWNEAHGGQSMAYLLTTGQSLLGLIMASHQAELTELMARPDVDPERVGVTGISMGGTHTLWFAALEPRARAAVAVSVAPLARADLCFTHHCLCDVMVGQFGVADEEMIQALCAPRPFLRIYPDGEVPLTPEGHELWLDGALGREEAGRRFGMDAAQLAERHAYTREAYAASGASGDFEAAIVVGPHAYTAPMRERAAGWLDHALRGQLDRTPTPDPPCQAIQDMAEAVAALNLWTNGPRPPEVLGPTAYAQRETAALVAQLPPAPESPEVWGRERARLAAAVRKALRLRRRSFGGEATESGRSRVDGTVVRKLVTYPAPDMPVPMLLFGPREGAGPCGRMLVLLDPAGMASTGASPRRRQAQAEGSWVLCLDPRGTGETRFRGESGGYMGFRDMDLCSSALKLGDTAAGYWVEDLLVAIAAARRAVREPVEVTVSGRLEMGLVAILAAGQSDTIQAVEADRPLASYSSPDGYGLTFAYSDEHNNSSVRSRPLGGYGSMAPCIPSILKAADIPQLAALVAPRPLTLREPLWASGTPLTEDEAARQFAWTNATYRVHGLEGKLRVSAR